MKGAIGLFVLVAAGMLGALAQPLKPCQTVNASHLASPKPKHDSKVEPARVHLPQALSDRRLLCAELIPLYPADAKAKHLEGSVVLKALIGIDGTIKELSPLSGNPIFIDSAMKAVKDWRYRPYKLKGKPVEVETEITVNFTIERVPATAKQNSQPASPTGN